MHKKYILKSIAAVVASNPECFGSKNKKGQKAGMKIFNIFDINSKRAKRILKKKNIIQNVIRVGN